MFLLRHDQLTVFRWLSPSTLIFSWKGFLGKVVGSSRDPARFGLNVRPPFFFVVFCLCACSVCFVLCLLYYTHWSMVIRISGKACKGRGYFVQIKFKDGFKFLQERDTLNFNFHLYSFLDEESKSRKKKEHRVWFLCVRYFVPSITPPWNSISFMWKLISSFSFTAVVGDV